MLIIRDGVVEFDDGDAVRRPGQHRHARRRRARHSAACGRATWRWSTSRAPARTCVLTSGIMARPEGDLRARRPRREDGLARPEGDRHARADARVPDRAALQAVQPRTSRRSCSATSVVKNALSVTGTPFLYKPSRLLGAMGTKNNQETTWTDGARRRTYRSISPRHGRLLPLPGELPAAERSAQRRAGQVRQGRRPRVRHARQVRSEPRHRQRRVGDSAQQHLQRSRPRYRVDGLGARRGRSSCSSAASSRPRTPAGSSCSGATRRSSSSCCS